MPETAQDYIARILSNSKGQDGLLDSTAPV